MCCETSNPTICRRVCILGRCTREKGALCTCVSTPRLTSETLPSPQTVAMIAFATAGVHSGSRHRPGCVLQP
ncbi:hypothetical protein PISMIDRAFT_214998 [Pisolithus microcarpus 441]|uniref:Uncharacterized protein n=1 Tax=Pisolithus microcarpus 441 TaxID=765257 RepID=A0A0C9YU80_9AGAM|nr:hypothetical protein PISMIDRAFT_214998 [Pisolithus microcarpus 441]